MYTIAINLSSLPSPLDPRHDCNFLDKTTSSIRQLPRYDSVLDTTATSTRLLPRYDSFRHTTASSTRQLPRHDCFLDTTASSIRHCPQHDCFLDTTASSTRLLPRYDSFLGTTASSILQLPRHDCNLSRPQPFLLVSRISDASFFSTSARLVGLGRQTCFAERNIPRAIVLFVLKPIRGSSRQRGVIFKYLDASVLAYCLERNHSLVAFPVLKLNLPRLQHTCFNDASLSASVPFICA